MEDAALLDALVELAEELGITVRVLTGAARDGEALQSGPCRVRGEPWLMLAAHEPLEARQAAAIAALREFASEALADRYLPPALRNVLESA